MSKKSRKKSRRETRQNRLEAIRCAATVMHGAGNRSCLGGGA